MRSMQSLDPFFDWTTGTTRSQADCDKLLSFWAYPAGATALNYSFEARMRNAAPGEAVPLVEAFLPAFDPKKPLSAQQAKLLVIGGLKP